MFDKVFHIGDEIKHREDWSKRGKIKAFDGAFYDVQTSGGKTYFIHRSYAEAWDSQRELVSQ